MTNNLEPVGKPIPLFYIRKVVRNGASWYAAYHVEKRLPNGHLWGGYVFGSGRPTIAEVMNWLHKQKQKKTHRYA